MKFSSRQIAASAAGAVLSAVIASIFGVKGTIVGVAIGSIVATTGTALVFQSIERTNRAVKQVVVRVPDNSLLRRLGGTKTSGVTSSESFAASPVHEEAATSATATEAMVGESRTSPVPVATSERRVSAPTPPAPRTNLPLPQIVGVVVGVFVVSLLFVTVVELIAGRPLADLFGHAGGGTTVGNIVQTPTTTLPPPTTTTTSTTSSTGTTSSSSTTSTVGGTTSSTAGGSTTTSSTGLSGATTTSSTG